MAVDTMLIYAESKAPARKAKQVLLSDSDPEDGDVSTGEDSGSEFGSQDAAAAVAFDDADEASDLEVEAEDVQEVSPPSRKRPAQVGQWCHKDKNA